MADILLTHANHLFFDRKQVRKMQPYPPLQTLLAAAYLRQAGFEVALFDATLEDPEEGFQAALAEHRPRLAVLCEDNFNFLTKMCLRRNRELAFFMCRTAREAGARVVAHGSDASDHVVEYLANGADYVLLGEVEETLLEVARRPGSAAGVAGVAHANAAGRVQHGPPRELMRDLDRLPFPAWDLVDVERYRARWLEAHGYFSLNMVSSRGCPYRCNWCAKPIYGSNYHCRSPRLVAEEMRQVKTRLAPDRIWFADDIFALSPRWTLALAEAVEELEAQIPFQMQTRCDLMTRDTVAALKRAGCAEVWMGAESGSQKILDAMDKGIRVEQIYRAAANLRAHGIRACLFLQFGYPGEDWSDMQKTIRMVREINPDEIGISVAYPLPGTKFYQLVEAELGAKKNWEDSDDLAMMFQGAYTSRFYRALRDALHREVDLARRPDRDEESRRELEDLWRQVEGLERTCTNPNPTLLWTCC